MLFAVEKLISTGRNRVSRTAELAAIRAGLPSLRETVVVPYPDHPEAAGVVVWAELIQDHALLELLRLRAGSSAVRAYLSAHDRAPETDVWCTVTAGSCSSTSR